MKKFLNHKNVIMLSLCAIVLCSVLGQTSVYGQCCRGDVSGPMMWGLPDGIISLDDLMYVLVLLNSYGPPYVAPAYEAPCADVADVNAIGLEGGDGQVDIGDLNFLVCYLYLVGFPYITPECVPLDYADYPSDPNILIWVNDTPWDGVSQVDAGDEIKVAWDEKETAWCAGFCNFNLNVSRGVYLDDFNTPIGWGLINFSTVDDGQGGIDLGRNCRSFNLHSGLVFTFSFQVPYEAGPAYTIHIRPTQGTWRRKLYNQLPTVDLQVKQSEVGCTVDFRHFARFAIHWLYTGPNIPADLYKDPGNIVDELDLMLFTDKWLHYCPYDWPLK